MLAGRFLPVVRTLVPAAAGSGGLRFGRFLFASVLGASAVHPARGVGWAAGPRQYVEEALGRASWVAKVLLVLAGAGFWWRRRRKAKRAAVVEPIPERREDDEDDMESVA